MSNDAFANLDVDLASIVCGGADASIDREVEMTVSAVATAVAEAVSDLEIMCVLVGEASAEGNFRGEAESRATAVANAFSRILSNASVCERCDSRVEAFVNTTREIVAEAQLDSFFELNLESRPGQTVEESERIFEREVEERIVDVLATVIADIVVNDDGCDVDVNPITIVGGEVSQCGVTASAIANIVEGSTIARLVQESRSFACEDGVAQRSDEMVLRAVATAMVDAVSQVDAFCELNGDPGSTGCALGDTNVRGVARAQAEAFASGFAEAGTCNCNETISLDTSAIADVFAEASSMAFANACASGTESAFMTDFEREVSEESALAVVRVINEAIAIADDSGSDCIANVRVCAEAQQCSGNAMRCRGEGVIGTQPCCDSDYHCVRRSSAESRCLRRDTAPPGFYEGTIELCALP
eukprot:jgi/Ulvmu1/1177/UM108_0004.1